MPDDLFLDDDDAEQEPFEPEAKMPEANDSTPIQYNEYLNAKFLHTQMGEITKA